MIAKIAKGLLKALGWKLDVHLPPERKFVLIGAPHTSNWDFPLALLCFWTMDLPVRWVAKKELFIGPLNRLFRALGGIPVDRSASQGFTRQIVRQFERSEAMVLTLSPEGTRSKTAYWKSGFYTIAKQANLPIAFGFIDYPNKTLGIMKGTLRPSNDIEKDMQEIARRYQSITGLHPAQQGPVRLKPKTGRRKD